MNLLKNYRVLNERYEGVPVIEIRNQSEVFAEMPVCMIPYEKEEPKWYLLGRDPRTKIGMVVGHIGLKEVLKTHKMYFLTDEGAKEGKTNLREVAYGEHKYEQLFPLGTDVSKLMIYNGEIVLFDNTEEVQEKVVEKEGE